jgi:phage major head subunit gpT-like protein
MSYPAQNEKLSTRGVKAMLLLALETGTAGWVTDLAMKTNSDQASESYAWLSAPPAMHEFVGKRQLNELQESSFTISNKDHEANIRVKSKDMRRDKTGQIQIRVNQLATRVLDYPGTLLSRLIMNGASSLCYDGQYFFDTDHSEGDSGTLSNKITFPAATGTTPTVDEFADAILAAIQAMYGFKDSTGEPMNQSAKAFTVMVPVGMMGVALKAVAILVGANGATATIAALKGDFTISVQVNPRLTWTDTFAVFRTDGEIKPFILQEEDGGADVVAIGDGSEYEQLNKEQIFGVDWSGNVGYGYWQGAVQVTFT